MYSLCGCSSEVGGKVPSVEAAPLTESPTVAEPAAVARLLDDEDDELAEPIGDTNGESRLRSASDLKERERSGCVRNDGDCGMVAVASVKDLTSSNGIGTWFLSTFWKKASSCLQKSCSA